MIFIEDNSVKVGGTVLPGLVKSIEVTCEAAIDEVEVQGSAVKPKQAVGYEDSKVKIELVLGSTSQNTADDQLKKIINAFRPKGQGIPQPLNITCAQTAAANVNKVLFEKITYKKDNKSDLLTVSLEFCEYVPFVIKATKSASASSSGLTDSYKDYLGADRGTAPRLGDKTTATPATDDRQAPAR